MICPTFVARGATDFNVTPLGALISSYLQFRDAILNFRPKLCRPISSCGVATIQCSVYSNQLIKDLHIKDLHWTCNLSPARLRQLTSQQRPESANISCKRSPFFCRCWEDACPRLQDLRPNRDPFRPQADGRRVLSVAGCNNREKHIVPLPVAEHIGHEASHSQEPASDLPLAWQSPAFQQHVVDDLAVVQLHSMLTRKLINRVVATSFRAAF